MVEVVSVSAQCWHAEPWLIINKSERTEPIRKPGLQPGQCAPGCRREATTRVTGNLLPFLWWPKTRKDVKALLDFSICLWAETAQHIGSTASLMPKAAPGLSCVFSRAGSGWVWGTGPCSSRRYLLGNVRNALRNCSGLVSAHQQEYPPAQDACYKSLACAHQGTTPLSFIL